MNKYVIFTDSACDISTELLNDWGVKLIDLSFRFENDLCDHIGSEIDIKEFYNKMRDGETAKTAAANPETFIAAFDEVLSTDTDILYIGFSSGLSTTFNSSRIAAQELSEKYPERKIVCVDTLAASAGQGLLLHFAVEKKNNGAALQEVADYIEEIKLKLCHWFTVEDLVYLKRGGRVSPTVAFVGSVLGIKPILHVDNEGKLINVSKARGRKASLLALVEKFGELSTDKKDAIVFISHADCLEDAEFLKIQISEKYGADVKLISDIGPVIGAHSGPGTMALFFLGKER